MASYQGLRENEGRGPSIVSAAVACARRCNLDKDIKDLPTEEADPKLMTLEVNTMPPRDHSGRGARFFEIASDQGPGYHSEGHRRVLVCVFRGGGSVVHLLKIWQGYYWGSYRQTIAAGVRFPGTGASFSRGGGGSEQVLRGVTCPSSQGVALASALFVAEVTAIFADP